MIARSSRFESGDGHQNKMQKKKRQFCIGDLVINPEGYLALITDVKTHVNLGIVGVDWVEPAFSKYDTKWADIDYLELVNGKGTSEV